MPSPAPESKPRIVVTRRLPGPVEARLTRCYDAILNPEDIPPSHEDIMAKAVEGTRALVVTVGDPIGAALIGALPASVQAISTVSAGHDHIDLAAARARGIMVTNTPDVLTEATADIAMLLILAAARRAGEGFLDVLNDRWAGWSPTHMMGRDLSGRRLGIVGMGRIGRAVAHRARAFGMAIHYHSRRRMAPAQEQGATHHATLESLLAVSDVLSIHCASTPETRGLIDAAALAQLPEGAILVNTARGDIVDDDALIAALRRGRLFAAGLDVYRGEPVIDPRYRELKNVFLLPHLGSATLETRIAMGMRALDNLDAMLAGKMPPNRIA
jgi:lactate dehydrogenase-like 2-hydroxyacid dehydrogenase